jgi:signal transduction histidine kinase
MATIGAGSRAHAARAPGLAALAAITTLAGAAVALSVALTLSSDHVSGPGVHAALMSWIILAYVFAGVMAWWRRPDSRLGPLMILAGFAVFLSSLASADAALPYTIGIAFDLLPPVLLLHLFLGFPSGRLERPVDRALVAAGYVVAFGAQLVGLALGGFGDDNLVALAAEPDAAYTLLRIQLAATGGLCLAGVALLIVRWRGSGRPLRRSRALLVDSFGLALVMVAVLYLSAAFGLVGGQFAFELLRRVTLFAIGLAPLAFLVGLLDARLGRATVGDLLVELRSGTAPGDVRAALARALRDPSVSLVYWLPEFGGWVDAAGRPVELPDAGADRAVTLIDRGAEHLAALLHDPSLDDEPELLEAVAAAAAIALENGRLQAELRARLEELKGSRARIVEAADAERRRIERDLHDGAQQRMVAIALQLRLLQGRIRDDPDAAERIATIVSDELVLSLRELRELARGIHPAVLEHGLAAALDSLATRSTVPTTVSFETAERLPARVELAAYFVASEALANITKYADATAATVRVRRTATGASIEIADDGIGGADHALGSGLHGLTDRVEALDGHLRVSSPAGGGTVVTAELPCGS